MHHCQKEIIILSEQLIEYPFGIRTFLEFEL